MNYCVAAECTMAVKSVKSEEVDEICRFIAVNTMGLIQIHDALDTIPEFPHAKIIYANYESPQHARKAVELTMVECTLREWGGRRTRAATKDKLASIKRSPENLSQLFPVFVGGLPAGNKQQQQQELEQLYAKYGSCWTAVNSANCYVFVNFDHFDSAMAALNDSNGIKYRDVILRANTAFDTAWAHDVWIELEKTGRLSFSALHNMARNGVRTTSGKPFYPKDSLGPLRCIPQFRVSDAEQHVTWARQNSNREPARFRLQETVANDPCAAWVPEASRAPSASFRPPVQPSELRPQVDADRSEAARGGSGDEVSEAGSASSAWGGNQQLSDSGQPAVQDLGIQSDPVQSGRERMDGSLAGSMMDSEPTECGTPSKYVCPIGQHLMQDPVRLSNGKVYDRPVIEGYLARGNHVCPLTQVQIDPRCIIPEPELKAEIARYSQNLLVDVRGSERHASPDRSSFETRASLSDAHPGPLSGAGVPLEGRRGEPLVLGLWNGLGSSSFKVVKRLGGGGMGDVYRAERTTRGQAGAGGEGSEAVALKICFPLRDGRRERNEREAANLRRVQEIEHENVVRLVGSGYSPSGRVVLVMEEIRSQLTLNDMLDLWPTSRVQAALAPFGSVSDGNLRPPFGLCMDVLGQLLSGMTAVHAHGIAHRDLTPSNVMLAPLGNKLRVVIIDFGLSKDAEKDHSVTCPGQSLGTAAYMSPEQIRGAAEGHEMGVDVWALGVMAYSMVEGRHPFASAASIPPRSEAEKAALIRSIESAPMPTLSQHAFSLPLYRFLSLALEKTPARRFTSAAPMQQAFLDWNLAAAEDGAERKAALAQATVEHVSAFLRRLGGKFASAAEVVAEQGVGGEDMKEFLEDEGREHNPLYMAVEKGGLGLGEIQVRKLRRELAKLFAEE